MQKYHILINLLVVYQILPKIVPHPDGKFTVLTYFRWFKKKRKRKFCIIFNLKILILKLGFICLFIVFPFLFGVQEMERCTLSLAHVVWIQNGIALGATESIVVVNG